MLTYRTPELFGVEGRWGREESYSGGGAKWLTSWYILKGITASCGTVTGSGVVGLQEVGFGNVQAFV